jgi:hypothetical protein
MICFLLIYHLIIILFQDLSQYIYQAEINIYHLNFIILILIPELNQIFNL